MGAYQGQVLKVELAGLNDGMQDRRERGTPGSYRPRQAQRTCSFLL